MSAMSSGSADAKLDSTLIQYRAQLQAIQQLIQRSSCATDADKSNDKQVHAQCL